jgi:hypothetical protein
LGLSLLLDSALLASPSRTVEDLTGKWTGSFIVTMDGETRDDTAYLNLKHSGSELTGTAGPDEEQQWTILKGKVEGNKVTFEVQSDAPVIKFELNLVEGHLKGQAKAEHDGHTMSAAVDVQRKAN